MLQSLGITTAIKWIAVAMIGVAVYKAFNGDFVAIADAVWQFILKGADVITNIWNSINSDAKKT